MHMEWGSNMIGQAGADLPDIDACAQALRGSLRRALNRLPPGFRGCIFKRSANGLRDRVCTEGAAAVAQGEEWHGTAGGVWVSLYPRSR